MGQAMAHGYRLYSNVWENKPPLLYLLYTAVYHLAGPSLFTIRIIATVTALLAVLLTYLLARVWTDAWAATASAMLAGLLLGVPFLEGTTANAEIFLAAASSAAALCVLRCAVRCGREVRWLLRFLQGRGRFDAMALAYSLPRSWDDLPVSRWTVRRQRCHAGVAASAGILPAMLRDAFLYDLGYVGRMNGSGVPWLLALKLLLLAGLTWRLRRAPFPIFSVALCLDRRPCKRTNLRSLPLTVYRSTLSVRCPVLEP